jgi:O-antigen/teichoic acid export membrane protein
VPTTLLTRALDYRRLAMAQTWSTLINAVVAVAFAVSGYGYWSLVLGQVAATVGLVAVLNAMRPWRLAATFSAARARELLGYGGALFASTLATFAVFNADNFLIGLVLGASALGYYTLALSWGSMVPVLMWSVVNAVLFPTFSTMQAERARIKSAYLRALHYVSVLGVLLNTVLFFVAPEFLVHVLGGGSDKWLPALTTLRILCVYGIVRVVLEPLGSVIMALGKTRILLRANVVAALLELALLYPALLLWGIGGAAGVVILAYATQYAIYYPFIRRELDIDWRDVVGVLRPALLPLLIAIPAFAAYDLLGAENTPLTLVARAMSGALSYVAAYVLLTRRTILDDIRLALGRP